MIYMDYFNLKLTPTDNTGKLIPPRKLHPTQWGYICPTETPEGHAVGVVKNLSMISEITLKINSDPIRRIINPMITKFTEINVFTFNKNNFVKVFINGDYLGFTDQPNLMVNALKLNRSNGLIHIHICLLGYS